MKQLLLLTLLTLNVTANAAVLNSDLDHTHQAVIAKAVAERCSLAGDLNQVSNSAAVEAVDQGINDVYYTTTFETTDVYDQVVSDKYLVQVKSVQFDSYDHVNKNWGAFVVESVQCTRAE